MKIETKFEIGQIVFIVAGNKLQKCEISAINIKINYLLNIDIYYTFPWVCDQHGKDVFAAYEDYIESIKTKFANE